MALTMPRPFRHKSGVYYLNVRVPSAAVLKLKGAKVFVPIGDLMVVAKLTDKAFVSLRTKEPALAKTRFSAAIDSLTNQLEALRAGPRSLPYKQVVALAGKVYRARVARDEADPTLGPETLRDGLREHAELIADLCRDRTDLDEHFNLDPTEAYIVAHAEGERGEWGADPALVLEPDFVDWRLEEIYGSDVNAVLAQNALCVDAATRVRLVREVARAAEDAARATVKTMRGDFSPDGTAARFPDFIPPQPASDAPLSRSGNDHIDVDALFNAWKAAKRLRKAASTLRRYGPSLASLAKVLKGRDIRAISDEDIWAWAEHRRDKDGISALTVNRNDLAAAQSIFGWATTREGGKLRKDNPVKGVRLELDKVQTQRPPTFFALEVTAILNAARAVKPSASHPRAAASRRWTSWVCAYTGARIQEVCWLERTDVWCEGGVWVIRFPRTKDGNARMVPVHAALTREGFLEFVSGSPAGSLFIDERKRKEGATRSPQEQRASELAEWIRKQVSLPPEISPNHAWRHTFCTRAESAGIPKRFSNAITGHNKIKDASDGYISPDISNLKTEMDKFPEFVLGDPVHI